MAKNELLPFANGADANVLPTNQWEALTDIIQNGFQSGVAKSEQVNRVLAQGAVASYVLGQLIVDELGKDATLDKDTLYQNLLKALQENAKDACVPLSGGEMTGYLKFSHGDRARLQSSVDNSAVNVLGGSGWSLGARGEFYGKANESYPGWVRFVSTDGTNSSDLVMKPDGTFRWKSTDVLTKSNGLALDGGTMTGKVKFGANAGILCKTTNDGQFVIRGGGDGYAYGANICLNGKEYSSSPGHFSLTAHNGTTAVELRGKPDGSLTWGGKNILTSAGGTLSGALSTSSTASLQSTTNTSAVQIYGGAGYGNGAYINLRGKDRSTEAGIFSLCATDGTNSKILMGKPDGTLTWANNTLIPVTNVYHSGKNWAIKFANGFIMQGGYVEGTGNYVTVTFHYPFASAPGTVLGHIIGDSSRNNAYSEFPHTITATNFKALTWGNFPLTWFACGY